MMNKLPPRFFYLWTPSIMLLTMVVFHIVVVYGFHLTPWRGGGFAMYASNDSIIQHRQFFAEALTEDGEFVYLDLKKTNREHSRKKRLFRKKYVPLKSDLKKMANHLIATDHYKLTLKTRNIKHRERKMYRPMFDTPDKKKKIEKVKIKAIRIWVARRLYNPQTGELSWKPLYDPIEVGSWS